MVMNNCERITIKIRKATQEDFRVLRSNGYKHITHFKIAFPFFRKNEKGFSFDLTKHVQVDEFESYVNELKKDIDSGIIYVVDPYLSGESSADKSTVELMKQ